VNIQEREDKHNSGKGAKYTRSRRPVKIVYYEEFETLGEALSREAQVKTWNKIKKEHLAEGKHPITGRTL
jgi:putative endonuclease